MPYRLFCRYDHQHGSHIRYVSNNIMYFKSSNGGQYNHVQEDGQFNGIEKQVFEGDFGVNTNKNKCAK